MENFAEFVAENYFSTVQLIWNYRHSGMATASFSVDDVRVTVRFENQGQVWNVGFNVERGDVMTGTMSAFDIFNGVLQAVQEFIEVRQPDVLVFVTKQDRLAGIYRTYLRRQKTLIEQAGYILSGFRLRRIKPSDWKE